MPPTMPSVNVRGNNTNPKFFPFFIFLLFKRDMVHLDSGLAKKLYSVSNPVKFREDHTFYPCLYYEL